MFIANDHTSFHLWYEESLVEYRKVLKYYDQDFLQIFIFIFMSLLTDGIVKNSHILTGIYFIFLKIHT